MRGSGQWKPDQITQTTITSLSKTKSQEVKAEEKQVGGYLHDIMDMRACCGINPQDRTCIVKGAQFLNKWRIKVAMKTQLRLVVFSVFTQVNLTFI